MKNDSTVFVGLDVHKDSNVVAYAIDMGEVQSLGNIGAYSGQEKPAFRLT